jgi:hypothetical protein
MMMTPFIRIEPIHLHQELVQGLLAFVMPAHHIHPPGLAQGIQFIDEDDAGRLGCGLGKKIANAGSPDADKHLHKLGTADAEERHFCLPATALARRVLPVPGGPTRSTPLGILPPSF